VGPLQEAKNKEKPIPATSTSEWARRVTLVRKGRRMEPAWHGAIDIGDHPADGSISSLGMVGTHLLKGPNYRTRLPRLSSAAAR